MIEDGIVPNNPNWSKGSDATWILVQRLILHVGILLQLAYFDRRHDQPRSAISEVMGIWKPLVGSYNVSCCFFLETLLRWGWDGIQSRLEGNISLDNDECTIASSYLELMLLFERLLVRPLWVWWRLEQVPDTFDLSSSTCFCLMPPKWMTIGYKKFCKELRIVILIQKIIVWDRKNPRKKCYRSDSTCHSGTSFGVL
jgi:hypothetical protein